MAHGRPLYTAILEAPIAQHFSFLATGDEHTLQNMYDYSLYYLCAKANKYGTIAITPSWTECVTGENFWTLNVTSAGLKSNVWIGPLEDKIESNDFLGFLATVALYGLETNEHGKVSFGALRRRAELFKINYPERFLGAVQDFISKCQEFPVIMIGSAPLNWITVRDECAVSRGAPDEECTISVLIERAKEED
jgi:hypothetical protein